MFARPSSAGHGSIRRRLGVTGSLVLLLSSSAWAVDVQFRTLDLTRRTPHEPYLKNNACGAVKALFLCPANQALGHVREIAQRADIECDYFAVSTTSRGIDAKELAAFRKEFAEKKPDVLVVMAIEGEAGLGSAFLEEIFARVRAGMGLVAYAATADLQGEPTYARNLTAATEDKGEWPAVAVATPPVRRFRVGQGRVALMVGRVNHYRDSMAGLVRGWTQLGDSRARREVAEFRWRGFEYTYAFFGQIILWAGRKDSGVVIADARVNGPNIQVVLRGAVPPAGELEAVVRSRRWERRARQTAPITAGQPTPVLMLEALRESGPIAVEWTLRDRAGKTLAFASTGLSPAEGATIKLSPADAYGVAGKPLECLIEATPGRDTPADARLSVALVDAYDRLIYRQTAPLPAPGQPVKVALPPLPALTVHHELVAALSGPAAAETVLAEAVANIYLLPPERDGERGFALGVYGAAERDPMHIQGLFPMAWEAGWTLHSHSYYNPLTFQRGIAFAHGAGIVAPGSHNPGKKERFATAGDARRDRQNLIMEPPLVPDAGALAAGKQAFQAMIRKNLASGARTTLIDDEREINEDYDFHPKTLDAFRADLREKYGAIAALNKAWETDFPDFNAATPKKRTELAGWPHTRNLAPWLEFRLFIADVIGRYYIRLPSDWAAEASPDAAIGEFGIYPPNADGRNYPVDWSRYARYYGRTTVYPMLRGLVGDYFRCFAPESFHGPWLGYGMMSMNPAHRTAPWSALFNGGRWAWYWELRMPGQQNYAMATSDQRLTPGYAALAAEEAPDLTGGIDRLLYAGRFSDDGIALAYSFPSLLRHPDAVTAWQRDTLKQIGLQYRFVPMDDVAAGALIRDDVRLLLAAEPACVSAEQAQAVRAFVENGGTFFCMGRPGGYELNGAPARTNALADLAGIDFAGAEADNSVADFTWEGGPATVFLAYRNVRVTDAAVLAAGSVNNVPLPVLTRARRGKGQVYWLNASFYSLWKGQGEDKDRGYAFNPRLFEAVARAAGIEPRCRFFKDGQPFADYRSEAWYYRSPSGRSLYVGRYVLSDAGTLAVKFPAAAHVYDLRAHRYLGRTDTVTQEYAAGRVQVYALLDYRVEGLEVSVGAPAVAAGGRARFACAVRAADGGTPDLHPLRVTVEGPDGRPIPALRKVVLAQEGKAEFDLPLALNDAAGRYEVGVLDVVSGSTAKTAFVLTGNN